MRHAGPYFELDRGSSGAHSVGHPHRIVVERLVAADLDQCWRQAGDVAIERGDVGSPRIRSGEILVDEEWLVIRAEHRIGRTVAPQ